MSPNQEQLLRRELGQALMAFVAKTVEHFHTQDDVMRQVDTDKFRRAVEKAAARGIEVPLAWHTLAIWTEVGKERIGYFARALETQREFTKTSPPKTPKDEWVHVHMEAECLFEIGRVHFHEGAPEAAERFFNEALPLARRADALHVIAGTNDDRLEGRIAELLLQLPSKED